MTPEEYYYRNKLKGFNEEALFEMRVKSLEWMLGCYKKGTIRRRTIVNLIPLGNLYDLLNHMEGVERYEDCQIIKEVIDTIYEQNHKDSDMSKKRKLEIIGLLENTIRKEQEKKGGGNKDLIEKLSEKLEDVREKSINKK
jgi:hypothetical protein